MPSDYDKKQLGQLVSAIWAKYLSLQGGDVQNQRVLLAKDKELFQRDKEIQQLQQQLLEAKSNNQTSKGFIDFESYQKSGKINDFIKDRNRLLMEASILGNTVPNSAEASAFGLIERNPVGSAYFRISDKGKRFFEWCILKEK